MFTFLALDVEHSTVLARYDPGWLRHFVGARNNTLTGLAKVITQFGIDPVVYPLFAVVAIAVILRRKDWRTPLAFVLWLLAGQTLRLLISQAIARPRPADALHLVSAGGYAFPSGHTTNATLAYPLIAAMLGLLFPAQRPALLAVAALIAAAVGLTRPYLGVHWPTDVIGGWSLGATWLLLGHLLVSWRANPRHQQATQQARSR